MLSRFVIGFLSRSKCLNFMAAVTVCSDSGAQENKICHCFHFSPFYLLWSDGPGCHNLSFFECWALSQLFYSPLSLSSKGSLVPLHFLPLEWCVCVCLVTQLCPVLCDPLDCSLPCSSVHGISQTRILGWVAISSSRGSSGPRDRNCVSCVSCTAGIFTCWATGEAHIEVVSSAYLRLLILPLAILIPTCDSSSLAFRMMHSAYKWNKQGDNIQPCPTPFPVLNQSVVPYLVLTVVNRMFLIWGLCEVPQV